MTLSLTNSLNKPDLVRRPTLPEMWLRRAIATVDLRFKFWGLAVRRAMGIAQPRKFDLRHLSEGLTFVLPGIEAESIFTHGICDGFADGGLSGAVKIFNWGLPFPGGYLGNLVRLDRNRRRAADLAREIMAYQDAYPGRPVNLAAHSGGAGIAVFALEALPPGREIHSLVILNGALSPTYDLSRALARTRRGILNSFSFKDLFVLNWGTTVFGTTDRKFEPACGCVGFRAPSSADADMYRKLTQVQWTPDIATTSSHYGGHITSAAEDFLQRYIAPWINGMN